MNVIIIESVLTCPHCGFARQETMPLNACQFFYECGQCKTLLSPRPGDCCVFCSFSSVHCPPVQQERGCCVVRVMLLIDAWALTGVLRNDMLRVGDRYRKPSGLTRRDMVSWKLANLTNTIFRRRSLCNGGCAIQFSIMIFDQFMKFRTK